LILFPFPAFNGFQVPTELLAEEGDVTLTA